MYNYFNSLYHRVKNKIYENPKETFRYLMFILIFSLGLSLILEIYFPPKKSNVIFPNLYNKSNKVINTKKYSEKEYEKIAKELIGFRQKAENGLLTKNDSIRINYLLKQINEIKNELKTYK